MTTMRFPAELGVLPQGVAFVADYATAIGFAPDRVAEIELAVGEVLTNICAYAYLRAGATWKCSVRMK
jgi:anti-sigma regulatory factor (Ser/Thr protein kinase)